MKLNKEELVIGAIFGSCFAPIIGAWAFLLASATSPLWALSGYGYSKTLRRLLCPALACFAVSYVTASATVWIALPLAFGLLSLGYGIPDSTDEGSTLGRFWLNLTGNETIANVLTRGIIYVGLFLTFWLANAYK